MESYKELQTGMNFFDPATGQYSPSSENVSVLPDGGACTNGQHKVFFSSDIGAGKIKLVEPDGTELESSPLCLMYCDGTNYITIAGITNSAGEIVNSNQVFYPDALAGVDASAGVKASLLYTYTKAGLEQDVILENQPPAPETFGLNPATTRLQVLTEFFDAPQPTVNAGTVSTTAGNLEDDALTFGTMSMVPGKAFLFGQSAPEAGILRHWLTLDGSQILVEEVPLADIAGQIQNLPRVSSRKVKSPVRFASAKGLRLPKTHLRISRRQPMRRMAEKWNGRGLVMDYKIINNSMTNFTFNGDTTYYVSGFVYLFGTSTFEGGAVIKFAPSGPWTFYSTGPSIEFESSNQVNWPDDEYRPVIFSAKDDNTIGGSISGSSGSPSGYYGDPMLKFASGNQAISNFRIAWAEQGVTIDNSDVNFYDGQFVNCLNGITGGYAGTYFENDLFANVLTNFDNFGPATVVAQNVTFSGSACLWGQYVAESFTFNLTNCILANITNLDSFPSSITSIVGAYNGSFNATNVGVFYYPTRTNPFVAVGGAGYYQATNSAFRDVGTPNVDPGLLADLAQKTTYPPTVYDVTNISSLGTLSPDAPRDTNVASGRVPDLGYHYPSLDYVFGGCDLSSNLTFTAGTAVGWFEDEGSLSEYTPYPPYGIGLGNGAYLSFNGNATQPNVFAKFNTVQESASGNWAQSGYLGGIMFDGSNTNQEPQLSANFTEFSQDAVGGGLFRDDWAYGAAGFENCEFYTTAFSTYDMQSVDFTNCLLFRCNASFDCSGYQGVPLGEGYAASYAFENCTFYNGSLFSGRYNGSNPFNDAGLSSSFWLIENCAFDGTAFGWSDCLNGNLTNTLFNYNAFNTNNLNWTNLSSASYYGTNEIAGSNIVLTANYNWQASWFGGFYLPTNSPLINQGSTNAGALGLYWFTTQTNQSIESNSIVDIAHHYVATDTNGNPLDTYAPGTNNYILYPNGPPTNWLEIVTNPVSETVTQGNDATFSVTAIGYPPPNYQWFWNGAPLTDGGGVSGSTSATLSLSAVQPDQAGDYQVVVTNISGSITSTVAVLIVQPAQTNYSFPPYTLSPAAYWNVTDISVPSQPVNIGELQAPFSETNYNSGDFNSLGLPPPNAPWHTFPSVMVTNGFGTTEYGGVSNAGTVFEIGLSRGPAVIHSFSGPDGAYPCSQLAISGSPFYGLTNTLYGTTFAGGSNGFGTVFKLNADGSGFTNLYQFTGGGDGRNPQTGLLIDGNTLYGTTSNSVFKINTDGSGFSALASNIVGASQLILSLSGGALYGTTYSGGASNLGAIFSINTDGSGFVNIYSFTGGTNGAYPMGGLAIFGFADFFLYGPTPLTFFGTTSRGGSNGFGMVYSINSDGTGFTNLYNFTGLSDGAYPTGSLLVTNNAIFGGSSFPSYLYGTTSSGGTNGGGTIFSMNLNGSGFQTLYGFGGTNGAHPTGNLAFAGDVLYGTTSGGGNHTNGAVFSINYDGSGFTNLYDFTGGSDGGSPAASLMLPVVDGPVSIWSLETTIDVSADNISTYVASIAMDNYDILYVNGNFVSWTNHTLTAEWAPYTSIASYLHPGENDIRVVIGGDDSGTPDSGGEYFAMAIQAFPPLPQVLYGTTWYGGTYGQGALFELVYSNEDSILHSFNPGSGLDGKQPIGDLVLSGTNLYGVTQYSGFQSSLYNNGDGTVYKISADGSNYQILYCFTNASPRDGYILVAGLILSGNTLYGTTEAGGLAAGTIFRINTDGSNYQILYNFGAVSGDGASPESPLLMVSNTLFGTTSSGGANGAGTIYCIGTNGSSYQTLYSFGAISNDGRSPSAGLTFLASSNALYGTTESGGTNGSGTVFVYNVGNSNYRSLWSFGTVSKPGPNPVAGLALLGSTLFGTTSAGGAYDDGTLFRIGLDGSGFTNLISFGAADSDSAESPEADLLIEGNIIYGTAYAGGLHGVGMIFTINTNGIDFNDVYDFMNNPDGASPEGGLSSP